MLNKSIYLPELKFVLETFHGQDNIGLIFIDASFLLQLNRWHKNWDLRRSQGKFEYLLFSNLRASLKFYFGATKIFGNFWNETAKTLSKNEFFTIKSLAKTHTLNVGTESKKLRKDWKLLQNNFFNRDFICTISLSTGERKVFQKNFRANNLVFKLREVRKLILNSFDHKSEELKANERVPTRNREKNPYLNLCIHPIRRVLSHPIVDSVLTKFGV